MATYLPLSLVISSIDFFTDGGNSCPLVKMLGLFPAFPQKIDDDLLRRRVARCFQFTRQLFGIQVPSEFRRRRLTE